MSEGGGRFSRFKININPRLPTKKEIVVYITLFLAEFIGTSILVLFGCMGCSVAMFEPPIAHHFIALAFGLAAFISLQTFIHISGSHINPQITLAAVILGKLHPLRSIVYYMGQFAGASASYLLLMAILPGIYRRDELCVSKLNHNLEVYQGLLVEIVTTAALIFTCGAIWDSKNAAYMDSVSLRLGLIIACLAMVGGGLSGASMNTARSFGPALINNYWDNHWIYWVGPTVGSIAASVIYRFIFEHFNDEDESE